MQDRSVRSRPKRPAVRLREDRPAEYHGVLVYYGEGSPAGPFVRGEPGDAPYSTNRQFDESA